MKKIVAMLAGIVLAVGAFTMPAVADKPDSPGSEKPSKADKPNGPQGKSPSDPDGNENGGADKPGGSGGINDDKDGNNGSGNDSDCEDDNKGKGVPGKCKNLPVTPEQPDVSKPDQPVGQDGPTETKTEHTYTKDKLVSTTYEKVGDKWVVVKRETSSIGVGPDEWVEEGM